MSSLGGISDDGGESLAEALMSACLSSGGSLFLAVEHVPHHLV